MGVILLAGAQCSDPHRASCGGRSTLTHALTTHLHTPCRRLPEPGAAWPDAAANAGAAVPCSDPAITLRQPAAGRRRLWPRCERSWRGCIIVSCSLLNHFVNCDEAGEGWLEAKAEPACARGRALVRHPRVQQPPESLAFFHGSHSVGPELGTRPGFPCVLSLFSEAGCSQCMHWGSLLTRGLRPLLALQACPRPRQRRPTSKQKRLQEQWGPSWVGLAGR